MKNKIVRVEILDRSELLCGQSIFKRLVKTIEVANDLGVQGYKLESLTDSQLPELRGAIKFEWIFAEVDKF
jgi:hypothetical protein